MSKSQIPEYVDPDFVKAWRKLEDIQGGYGVSMLKNLIFDRRTEPAWKKLNSEREKFVIERSKVSGDEGSDPRNAYISEVISPLILAFIEGFDVVKNGVDMAKPQVLLRKAKRVKNAVDEMQDSLNDLEKTPQFYSFYQGARRELFMNYGIKNRALDFQESLDLFGSISKAYIKEFDGKNGSFKVQIYVVKLILNVFHTAFGKGLSQATAIFSSVVMDKKFGEEIEGDYVTKISTRADFKVFNLLPSHPLKGVRLSFTRDKTH